MKKGFFSVGVIIAAALSSAQVAREPAQKPAGQADVLASGTVLSVELSKTLDAKKSKENDKVEARTATDLLAHGQIVVPRNTKIIGHVTQAKARSKTSPDSSVGFAFDRMLLKDGREVPLQLVVQAIARPLQVEASSEGNLASSPSTRQAPGMPPMTGQRGPVGDVTNAGGPTSYPGDPSAPPDPLGQGTSTIVPLSPTSHGVVGMKGLALDTSGQASVLSSNSGNVRLDSGTQLILRVQ